MKEDLPYFSHDNDSRNHPKMKALRSRFGWVGYGQFWALNEMIAGAAYARLDISRPVVRSSTACELSMTPEAFDSFLDFLSNQDECGLVNYENGVLTTDRTQENYANVEANRTRKRVLGKSGAEKRHSGAEKVENGAPEVSKVKESKVKEKKVNESKPEREFIPPTLTDITTYAQEKGMTIDCKHFLDHYEASNWLTAYEEPVKNWKQKMITWQSREKGVPPPVVIPKCPVCGVLMYDTYCRNDECPTVRALFDDPERDKIIASMRGKT